MKNPLQPGFRPWESHTTALAGDGKAAPLWCLRHHLSPSSRGHYGCSALCHMTLRENIERFILPPE